MDGGMATSAITATALQKLRRTKASVRHLADENLSTQTSNLGMAFETEIVIAFRQHLRIDGTVNLMASHTTLPDGFMFENMRFGLRPVTLGTLRIHPRHENTFRRVNVRAMRIVAGGATHFAFD